MPRRNAVWIAGVALLLCAAPLSAQQRGMGGGMMRPAPTLAELDSVLALTDEQKRKAQDLLQRFESETREARETMRENMRMVREGSVTRDAVRDANMAAMAVLREKGEKLNQELRALLTPGQQTAFDSWLAARRAQGPPGGRPPAG